jgi:catechol 2,3-dioxygenase-like lactoylglutathione lyase family enzyme
MPEHRSGSRSTVTQYIAQVSIVVADYDEAISFYVDTLGFTLVEDTAVPEQKKRWVVVAPPGSTGCTLLLARAVSEAQNSRVGNQTGGRIFLFLHTDDFERDYANYKRKGVVFVRDRSVGVFQDLYGNLWDLVQPNSPGH